MCRIHVIGTERKRKRRKTWRDSTRKLRGSWPRRAKSHFILAKVNNGYNNCTVLMGINVNPAWCICSMWHESLLCVFHVLQIEFSWCCCLGKLSLPVYCVRAFVCTNILMMHSHISTLFTYLMHTLELCSCVSSVLFLSLPPSLSPPLSLSLPPPLSLLPSLPLSLSLALQRKALLVKRYKELKESGQLERVLRKRRKRNTAKDRRKMLPRRSVT